ncbi:glycoside hydrolase family 127 protein [Gilvimarinus agarilyticus]|uniref:glycoside hydrolase family 127 protein n=1 Tax=Gilvimarinus sp. 2_MG-2023 TaxID=3062666 RepID=UPI001C097CB6|nr:beta-L-arabinofuranosidase domain-containing protein [Gilvimarinus sp. 2_MG-2023]MBU2886365.1 glycoside hydrolase family 127 protein [Gilvimarinus agarilyticus]MDO6571044.1 glycoside hydrolase family 127 protein [Gilvimarinus sp. 2_MG-2023]
MSEYHKKNAAIVGNSESPYVKLRSINMGDCQWTEGFWADKFQLCEEVMAPHMGTLLKGEVGHAYNNFKVAAGLMEGEAKGMLWHDGDFYKWMEACIYIYAHNKDEAILKELDEIIDVIAKAQEDDGYLHTHVQINNSGRWRVVTDHELYNFGHLIQGGLIHYRITGKTNWFDLAVKAADYLYAVFGPREERLARFGFNPSQIMSLVELYRTTRNKKYVELADIFVTMRGSVPMDLHETVPYWFTGDQCQMKTPLREEVEAVGHAVTGMYLWAGAADVYAETGDQEIIDALDRIWDSAINHKMYLTGALGQVHHGAYDDQNMIHEGFIDDYLMPNSTAYNETCANISNAMFNWRMMSIKGEAKYGDIMETVLYNSAMVGISNDGKHYFYANPLRFNHGQREYSDHADCTESADREPYIECFCCPPNLVRTIAKVSGWAYCLSENGIAVNLYGSNKLHTQLNDGSDIKLTQETEYPWDGSVSITIDDCKSDAFDLMLRIPGWVESAEVQVNGEAVSTEIKEGEFFVINRQFKPGDNIVLSLPMSVDLIEGHPRIEEVRNQVALRRGPVVYAVESPDLPEGTKVLDVYLDEGAELQPVYKADMLGGITVIETNLKLRKDKSEGMYRKIKSTEFSDHKSQFVPYFSWSNRGTAEMSVFVPLLRR